MKVLIQVILLACLLAGLPAQARKAVLILFPLQADLPQSILTMQGLTAELEQERAFSLDLYSEYLELSRFQGEEQHQSQLGQLKAKYGQKQLALVIVVNEVALAFWLQHRAGIAPEAPVVFLDVVSARVPALQLPPGVTGVSGEVNHSKSVEWLLRVRPRVKEIVLVHGVGAMDQRNLEPLRELQATLQGKILFTDLSDLPLAELKRRVAALPQTSAVLFHLLFQDAEGQSHRPIDVVRELAAVSPVPVLGGYDQFVGTGIVGGYTYSNAEQARAAARMGLRLLRGEAVSANPIELNRSNRFVFDHPVLLRFGIPLSVLPPESLVKNRQYSHWELYGGEMVVGIVVLAVLAGLVLILLRTVRHLHQTRGALQQLNTGLDLQVQARTQELERAFRAWNSTFDAMQDGVCLLDPEGRIVQCNRAMQGLTNLSQEGMQGHRCFEIMHHQAEFIPDCPFQRMLQTGQRESSEFLIQDRWFEAVADPLRDGGGISGAVHILHDVTARKWAESDRKRITELYATLSQANQAIVRTHSEIELFGEAVRVCVDFGQFALAWVGEPGADGLMHVLAAQGPELGYLEGLQIHTDPLSTKELGPNGIALQEDRVVVVQDWEQDQLLAPWRERGHKHGLHASAAFPLRQGGRIRAILNLYAREPHAFAPDRLQLLDAMVGDLSYALDALALERAHQLSTAELQASEERFRLSFDSGSIGRSLTRPDGRLLRVNSALCRMLGYEQSELETKNFAEITPPDDLAATREYVRSLLTGAQSTCRFEKRFFHKDGHIIWVDVNSTLLRDPVSGEPLHMITDVVDITERKRAEAAQTRLLHILESSLNEIYVFDSESLVFDYVNAGALSNLGYTLEAMRAMTPLDLKPRFTEASFRAAIASLLRQEVALLVFETVHRRADGSLYPVEVHLQVVALEGQRVFLAVILDITERQQAEARIQVQLEELQRWNLAMLGREDRIQELKREVNQCCRTLKEEPRYPSQGEP